MTSPTLIDPESHEPLVEAGPAAVERLAQLVREGRARRTDGEAIAPFDGAWVPPGRRRAYPVRGGIPCFLLEERLELDEALP